ncbi:MAG: hypothetical protein IKU53_02580 [Firmicutes bacterium]|nr:hypothetical protein [Bacillota bacterium]
MKRKLLVLALAFIMLFTSSVTAFAETEGENPTTKICQAYELQPDEDMMNLLDDVAYIYEAYMEVEAAVEEVDRTEIHEAVYLCKDYDYLIEQLDAQQYTWLGYLLELGEDAEAEVVLNELFNIIYPADVFLALSDLYSPNVENINDTERLEEIISLYEETFENGEAGETGRALFEAIEGVELETFIEEVEVRIEELNEIESASENARYVFNNLNGLYGTLKYAGDAVIQQAIEDFSQVLDKLENLTDTELADLAKLLGVADGEEAKALVYSEWGSICAYLELGGAMAAFSADTTVDNAKVLVESYEKALASEQITALVFENYSSIEEVKKAATDVLATVEKEESKEEIQLDEPKEEQKPSHDVPKTGDNSLIYPLLMILSAGAFIFLKKSVSINK